MAKQKYICSEGNDNLANCCTYLIFPSNSERGRERIQLTLYYWLKSLKATVQVKSSCSVGVSHHFITSINLEHEKKERQQKMLLTECLFINWLCTNYISLWKLLTPRKIRIVQVPVNVASLCYSFNWHCQSMDTHFIISTDKIHSRKMSRMAFTLLQKQFPFSNWASCCNRLGQINWVKIKANLQLTQPSFRKL